MSRRAVFFINSLRAGGAEHVCVTLANEFTRSGWRVELLVLNLDDAILQDRLAAEIGITDLGIRHARFAVFSVWRYISGRKPGLFLVFNHQLAVLLLAIRLIRRADYRIVARNISTLSRQAAHETSLWHRHVVNGVVRLLYRRADSFVAQSQGMRGDLIRRYGVEPGRVVVIPNPLPLRFVQSGATPTAWAERDEELLFVGRLHPAKDLELMLRAVAACAEEWANLTLRLVGDGAERAFLEALATSLGISGRVFFEGPVTDTLPFYQRARLTLLTSHYEGFPNVLIESLSQGTPVVSVDCESGPAEIILEGINGRLVKGRDPLEFARAISIALHGNWDVERVRRTAMAYCVPGIAGSYQALLECIAEPGKVGEPAR